MSDKGIIFSAAMVRALLAGRKTQTRRLLNDGPKEGAWHCDPDPDAPSGRRFVAEGGGLSLPCRVPYATGDRLYVREAMSIRGVYTDVVEIGFKASESGPHTKFVEQIPVDLAPDAKVNWPRYRPSIHMPRWASRLWLTVTDVRVQRLQSISEVDCIAEGPRVKGYAEFRQDSSGRPSSLDGVMVHTEQDHVYSTPRCWYRELWDSLHTEPGQRWDDDPWVVAVSFDVHQGNVDRGAA